MKGTYPWLLFAVVFFTACNTMSARDYNNLIVEKENKLASQIIATEESVGNFAQENKFDSVAAVSGRMVSSIDQTIGEIEKSALPSAKGAEEFRKASLEYFQFISSIYVIYKNYGLAKNSEERVAEAKKVQTLAQKKKLVLAKMQMAQRKFGAENNFTIEKK
jgi:hypothetical protein